MSKSDDRSQRRRQRENDQHGIEKVVMRFGLADARKILFVAAFVIGAVFVGYVWWLSEPHLQAYINKQHQIPIEVRFEQPIAPIEGLEERLLEMVYTGVSAGPVGMNSHEMLQQIHTSLAETGWFGEDLCVLRDLESGESGDRDVVLIQGRCKQPGAFIRSGDMDILVDRIGCRLPVSYDADAVTALPVLTGARSEPPQVSDTWPGRDVNDGLSLLRFLRGQDPLWLGQIRQIDISNTDGHRRHEPRLILVTDKGYRIAWGRAVGEENGIDIPPGDKVRLLNEYAAPRGGRIGDPLGVLRVDLPLSTLDEPFARQ